MEEIKKRILILEPSDTTYGIILDALQSEFDIDRGSEGFECIEKLYKNNYNAVVLDFEGNNLRGQEVCFYLKRNSCSSSLPVIVHSSGEESERELALFIGADEYISKSFNSPFLLNEALRRLALDSPIQLKSENDFTNEKNLAIGLADSFFKSFKEFYSLVKIDELHDTLGIFSDTSARAMEFVKSILDYNIIIIYIKNHNFALVVSRPSGEVFFSDVKEFEAICLEEFQSRFPEEQINFSDNAIFNIQNKKDFFNIKLSKEKIHSIATANLEGRNGNVIGIMSVGHFKKNFYSESDVRTLKFYSSRLGRILESSLDIEIVNTRKRNLRKAFTKFVPDEIVNELIINQSKSDSRKKTGERRKVAVLFSDIRSFTEISEKNSAEDVVNFLNNYFNIMCESITDFGGTIDKFIGDAILAIFGAPNSYPDNAMRAVKASIAMAKSLKRVKVQNLLLPESGLGMGIGIHEGDAIVGNVGSSAKFDYTVIGDTVNLASRLEGITKIYKKQIIISEDVAICLDKRIKLRELDKVAVKGKSKPSTIFSVEAGLGDLNEPGYELHRKAMSMFRLRNWNLSKKYFQEVLEIFPDDFISKLYLTRCEKFLIHPPSDDWDGTFTMETK